jgi:hypothetical protein
MVKLNLDSMMAFKVDGLSLQVLKRTNLKQCNLGKTPFFPRAVR